MLERKKDSKDQQKEKDPLEKENLQQDLDNAGFDISSVTDVDILTKKGPNKDDQNEENERTDGSLRK